MFPFKEYLWCNIMTHLFPIIHLSFAVVSSRDIDSTFIGHYTWVKCLSQFPSHCVFMDYEYLVSVAPFQTRMFSCLWIWHQLLKLRYFTLLILWQTLIKVGGGRGRSINTFGYSNWHEACQKKSQKPLLNLSMHPLVNRMLKFSISFIITY